MNESANESARPSGERPCPICKETMESVARAGIRVDICKEHGVWLDDGELKRILSFSRRQSRGSRRKIESARRKGVMSGLFWGTWALLDDGGGSSRRERRRSIPAIFEKSRAGGGNADLVPEGARPCPICDETMEVQASENVVIDCCEQHGVWLDEDELEGMVARARNRSRLRTRRQERDARRRGAVDANLFGLFALLR